MLRLVEITSAETGWQRDWYCVGERHWVYQDPDWPRLFSTRWMKAEDYPMRGIAAPDCKIIIPAWHPLAIIMTLRFWLSGERIFDSWNAHGA